MKLTTENTMELPIRPYGEDVPRVYDDDTWYQKEPFWKEDKYDFFNYECDSALIATGIGTRSCPTIGEWAAFAVGGAIVATLTGKYVKAPEGLIGGTEQRLWAALWRASEENGKILDRKFLACMLREFFPRRRGSPPDRPYHTSNFEYGWSYFEYADTGNHSVGNVRLARFRKGLEDMKKLEDPVAASIRKVAEHVPTMLEIAIHGMKGYMW